MASGDTALWLHNKLGSTDDLWSGKSICSQLSQDKLQNINACFHTLQPHVKVKLMLSFLHIPRRNVDLWKTYLEEILMMAINDSDQWVSMIGEILRTYPATGAINLELEDNNGTFAEVLSDLKKLVKKSMDMQMLPMECQFLNKTALIATTGQQPLPVKHFALKRKPKSATLRAELLQKSSEVASNKKRTGSEHLPIKVRSFAKKMDDSTPMRGFSAKNSPTGGFISPSATGRRSSLLSGSGTPLGGTPNRMSSLKKEGGIKLLDITEQPVGAKEAKRRQRKADMEAMEQAKKIKEEQKAAAAAAVANATTTVPYTPDYAAGLVSPAPAKIHVTSIETGSVTSVFPTQTVSYVPGGSGVRMPPPNPLPGAPLSATSQQARDNLQQQLQQQLGQPQIRTQVPQIVNQSQPALQPQPGVVRPLAPPGVGGGQLQPLPPLQHLQQQQQIRQQQQAQNIQHQQTIQQPQVQQLQQPQQQIQPHQQPMAPDQQQQQPKKGLSLTRDQMLEAQEMFRTSNKVTRPEKALILGFMAGSRENPCPQQGNILSIRLSESKELVTDVNQTQKEMIVDTFFQMNYLTGDWKRVKKFREVDDSIL